MIEGSRPSTPGSGQPAGSSAERPVAADRQGEEDRHQQQWPELRPLDGIGLADVQMDSVSTLVLTHVEGVARARAAIAQTQRTTGMTEQEWWVSAAPALERVLDARHFPVASCVGQAAGEAFQAASDPAHAFLFGLERILDGVERLIATG